MSTQSFKIKAVTYPISDGPNMMDLFVAVAYAYDERRNFTVMFRTEDGHDIIFRPIGICHEDGSGRSFNIEGYVVRSSLDLNGQGGRCEIYYNSRTRRGNLKLPYEGA